MKTVLITGASSGIGEALAREYSARGAQVVLLARRRERLEQLSAELKTPSLVLACDVTRPEELKAAVVATIEKFGAIDTVIANAGFGVVGRLDKLKIQDYRTQFETNVFGVLETIYATLAELKKSKGSLAIMGSVTSYVGYPEGSPYAMSKFAVRALADSIRWELAPSGVSVTLINPGFVESEIRAVDNQGRHHGGAVDPMPKWLVKSTSSAARQMVNAIEARKSERVITLHGKLLVLIKRHFPALIELVLKRGVRSRKQPQ